MGTNRFGANELIEAIRANSLHRVVAALDDGADIEAADIHGIAGLPLRTACFTGNVPIIRELINRGADINAPTADGPGAPLRLALRAGHMEIAALLLAHHAQIPFDLDIPPSIFERAKEISSGGVETLDVPMLEFERHDFPTTAPAASQPAAEAHGNVIEFVNALPEEAIEQVDMKGVYGVDTNILAVDFERNSGAWEKVDSATETKKP